MDSLEIAAIKALAGSGGDYDKAIKSFWRKVQSNPEYGRVLCEHYMCGLRDSDGQSAIAKYIVDRR
jgi:hypothetical protein